MQLNDGKEYLKEKFDKYLGNGAKTADADVPEERWHYIDLMEVIGIFFVIIYHFSTYNYDWLNTQRKLYYLRYFMRTALSMCVPIFFFTNGYLILNRPFSLKKHVMKCVRIVFLTVFWGFVSLVLIMFSEGIKLSLKEILYCLWNWNETGWINHVWYMGALFCVYAFVPLLKPVFDINKKYFVFFTLFIFVLTYGGTFISYGGAIFANVFLKQNIAPLEDVYNMFDPLRGTCGYALALFCVGGIMHYFKDRLANRKILTAVSAIVLIADCFMLFSVGTYFSLWSGEMWDVVWNGYDTIFTFVNVICVFILALNYKGNLKIVRIISANTLGIYFLHNIFIHLLKWGLAKLPLGGWFMGDCLRAVVVLFVSLGVAVLIRKIPVVNRLLKI